MGEDPGGPAEGDDVGLVLTTVPDLATGEGLVRKLLEERRIACGNLVPGVTSLYRWEGSISSDSEVLVLMKVRVSRVGEVFGRITELHPYTIPELLELPVSGVSLAYRQWVMQSTEVSE
jgi:periplasmic divalent cation tolerance protein